MVKHIKKNYAKDGKLTDREKSIAYATAWKHHNEETEHTTHAKDVVKIPKSAQKDMNKQSKKRDKDWWKHQDKAGYVGEGLIQQFEPEYSEAKRRVGNKIRGKLGLKKKPDLDWKKDKGIREDARYDPTPGGMEWGTDKGDNYFRDITPGQSPKNRKALIKPLPIKSRKPEDEMGTKITEGVIGGAIGGAIGGSVGGFSGAVTGAKVGSAVGDAAAIGAGAYGAYKVGKGAVKAGKAVGKGVKKVKDKIKGKKEVKEEMSSAQKSKHEYPINNEKETFDKGDEGHWLTGKDGEWYIETPDVDYLDKEAENFTFDQAVDFGLYDDDELEYEDFDNTPGFDNEVHVTEALSVQGRIKRRFSARRNKQKLKVARRIALRRGSTPDRLKKRATRGARLMVYKRLLRGRDRAGLPPAEKARLERMIQRFQPLVSRIAVKLLPQMRKNEIKRLTSRGKMKAKTSKKFKPAKPVKSASQKRAKKFKIKANKYKPPKRKAVKPRYASGGPTLKKASKSYKAFSYSIG